MLHAQPLELDRVDAAGDDEVVAQRDAVPALLGRPPADPLAPRAVAAEAGGDLAVVGGQVVLGEQVDRHRRLRDRVERRVLRAPVLAAEEREVATAAPRHVVVRVPFLGQAEVAVEVLGDDGFEVVQQALFGAGSVSGASSTSSPSVGELTVTLP